MKMNTERKAAWVKALRSGEYKQGDAALRMNDDHEEGKYKYCCLGVLCDLAQKEKWIEGRWSEGGSGFMAEDKRNYSFPPVEVAKAVYGEEIGVTMPSSVFTGMDSFNPLVEADGYFHRLSELNDIGINNNGPLSFNEIADLIEKQL